MTVARLRFVDSISASPTVLLDLNDGNPFWLSPGWSFPRPPLRRSFSGTLLRDGQALAASAYDNRQLVIPLVIKAGSPSALATAYTTLHRLLDQPMSLLEWRKNTAGNSVFFRVLRSPDYDAQLAVLTDQIEEITLNLVAEPFALGLAETPTGGIVKNDPTLPNAQYLDVTGVKGDVETPALIQLRVNGAGTYPVPQFATTVVAIRRRGTPSNIEAGRWSQAEDLTGGSGVATVSTSNDPLASGSGNNYAHSTLPAGSTSDLQLIWHVEFDGPFSGVPGADSAGVYRLYARMKKTAAGDVVKVSHNYGWLGTGASPEVTVASTSWRLYDLGLIAIPAGNDTTKIGYNETQLPVSYYPEIDIWARRVSGTGGLDFDYLTLVPADDALVRVYWSSRVLGGSTQYSHIDGPRDSVYTTTSGTMIDGDNGTQWDGSIPCLSPGVTNRLYVLRTTMTVTDTPAYGQYVEVIYWPRYLYVA